MQTNSQAWWCGLVLQLKDLGTLRSLSGPSTLLHIPLTETYLLGETLNTTTERVLWMQYVEVCYMCCVYNILDLLTGLTASTPTTHTDNKVVNHNNINIHNPIVS
ncbi:hypothetical protein CHARACLAT_005617 [Characodon lateralis]|uniref:Uncharacterized protein n=1 Tax=Characodon lateralis TaxID=208331 RepID=A0ABU7DY62_9TELE|nr:hypothetical protein [Characodon lateralis]